MLTRRLRALALSTFVLGRAPGVEAQEAVHQEGSREFRVALTGYVQADVRSYRGWSVHGAELDDARAPTAEMRRLRVGVDGRYRQLRFELDLAPAFDPGDELKDAWLGFHVARALEIRVGHQKLPVSPEWLTSSARTDLIERAAMVRALGAGRDWGVQLLGSAGPLDYRAGVFRGDGSSDPRRASRTVGGRLAGRPRGWLELGASFSQGQVDASPRVAGGMPEPRGFAAGSATGFRFFSPVFVDGRRRRLGADVALRSGAVSLRGEILEQREHRVGQGPLGDDLPELRGRGWAATASWLVTGEKKGRRIRPRRAFPGGPGAVEIALRHESLRANDVEDQGFESFGDRARNLRVAGLRTTTGGVNWWPAKYVRIMGNVAVEEYEDLLGAPEPGRRRYVSLLARLQLELP